MNTPDLHNPYAPPVDAELKLDQPGKQPSPERMRARRDTRACLLLLMLPATMNWVFYRIAFGPARVPHQEMLFQLAAAGLGGLLLWLYLLNALELATKLLHWPLGKQPL